MLFKALSIIKTELGAYIEGLEDGGQQGDVVLGNIALQESGDNESISNRIVITMVNIEEESALKNSNGFYRTNGNLKFQNPPVYLNLYLLFTANWQDAYENALRRLSNIIEFFQGNNIFTIQNSPLGAESLDTTNPDIVEMKLILDMYTMTFEQINHLWGSLGGKQTPFVLYKGRLVKVNSNKTLREGRVIERTQTDSIPE